MKTTMSIMNDGSQIVCDGAGCRSGADAPIALRPLLSGGLSTEERRIDGWLFVAGGGQWKHFCPLCQGLYLIGLDAPVAAIREE